MGYRYPAKNKEWPRPYGSVLRRRTPEIEDEDYRLMANVVGATTNNIDKIWDTLAAPESLTLVFVNKLLKTIEQKKPSLEDRIVELEIKCQSLLHENILLKRKCQNFIKTNRLLQERLERIEKELILETANEAEIIKEIRAMGVDIEEKLADPFEYDPTLFDPTSLDMSQEEYEEFLKEK